MAQVAEFMKGRLGVEVEMGGCKAPITTFIVEPSSLKGLAVKAIFLPTEKPMTTEAIASLIATLPLEVRGKIGDFIKAVFAVFQDLDFSFLEMNPFTLVNDEPYPLDMRGELDDTAAFKNFQKWGNVEFPLPFGRVLSPTETFIHSLDEKTSASLKFTVLNPKGRIWTMVAGGGASVIYADTHMWRLFSHNPIVPLSFLDALYMGFFFSFRLETWGYASELGNYAEYSGAPNEEEVLQYARVVIDCATANPDGPLREKESKLKAARMHIYVRRGGPNYQTGLAKMRALGEELGVPLEVFGPEATMTGICKQAIECIMSEA
ncbi:ATP-citrate synthase alpha chain protein 2 [Camellia lanceoleosa]|uniref:ATP-citrate synthase alpha chain protein 2 n=1 Tax=Camellia lanceoleosa TaxID=1840588 RepID=A0ACC0HD17_9ERIC|nr:ATP-citrate synthase alpha chain protein 2 [Camellia lanceoleosa]